MTRRQDLEVALAQAENARELLEAALAEAKAALLNTVTDASRIDANQEAASAKVEKARARCRQLRAALAEPKHADFIARSRERFGALPRQPAPLQERQAAANPPPQKAGAPAVRAGNDGSQAETRRRQPMQRFNAAVATSPHLRETIGFLALVLAYLQYYYFDVQLQIVSLPSVVWSALY